MLLARSTLFFTIPRCVVLCIDFDYLSATMRWHCHHKVRIIYNKHAKHSQQRNNHPQQVLNQSQQQPTNVMQAHVKGEPKCKIFYTHFNTNSSLFTHQLQTRWQIFNSREGFSPIKKLRKRWSTKRIFLQKDAISTVKTYYLQQNTRLFAAKRSANSY